MPGSLASTTEETSALNTQWNSEPYCNAKEHNMQKLSARNQIKGRILEVRTGVTTSHVRIDIGNHIAISATITNEAVAELGLRHGVEAWAVIKASDVMIGV
jgi:molybdopterin-binding protein